jgi:ABC-type nitrate/sulfonate/bicarbonate transport system substrate-binding protein
VAVHFGYYGEHGVQVSLADLTHRQPAAPLQVSCGAALFGALRGEDVRIALVATRAPLFWLYGLDPAATVLELAGGTIASFPPGAPPDVFLRRALAANAVDPSRDVDIVSARDDVARVGLLLAGEVAGAVLSSAVPGPRAAKLGLRPLLNLGDHVPVPSTGLAVSQALLDAEPELVDGACAAHRRALSATREHAPDVTDLIARCFSQSENEAHWTYSAIVERLSTDGRVGQYEAQTAVDAMANELGIATPPGPESIYPFLEVDRSTT